MAVAMAIGVAHFISAMLIKRQWFFSYVNLGFFDVICPQGANMLRLVSSLSDD